MGTAPNASGAAEPAALATESPKERHRLRDLLRCRPFLVLVVAGTIAAFGNNIWSGFAFFCGTVAEWLAFA